MANYQPNYIYSPLYGNRYMGGSRTPAPSTGGAGQVDTTAIQSRNTAVGVPYSPVVQEQQGPYGFSSTGRDQSAIESLGTFGFRDMSGLTMDPFEGTDYLTNGFGSPAPINTRYVESVPEATVAPPVSFDGGGNDNNEPMSYGQGIQAASSGSNDSMSFETMPMDLAWGLYGVGRDLPPLAQALVPGVQAAQFVGGQMLDQQIDAIDSSFDALNTPEGMLAVSDQYGNVTYQYDPANPSFGAQTNLDANQYAGFVSSLPEGAEVQGVDAVGNVNVTMPDGTTARAGVSPTTGQVNTYNFNVNDTATYSNAGQFQDNDDGDQIGQDAYGGGSTSNTAASEDANVGSTPSAPQTNSELDADSADNGSDSGGK